MERKLLLLLLPVLALAPAFCATSIIIGVRELGVGAYQGVTATLEVTMKPGTGNVFIDTLPLTEIDTQTSARLAQSVACETLLVDCSKKDFFFVIRGEFPMISGPSAGAAMTVLAMSELSNIPLKPDVAMTGTVNPDGSIGPIGGLLEKAVAASEAGTKTFLCPQGQLGEIGDYQFANNMQVYEVSTVAEAFTKFTGYEFTPLNDTISLEIFNEVMKPMSEDLLNYSNYLMDNIENAVSGYNLTEQELSDVELLKSQIPSQLLTASEEYNNTNYYSAASYAVSAGVSAQYTNYLAGYFAAANKTDYLNSVFEEVSNHYNTVWDELNSTHLINHANDIESISIAIDRFFEADTLLTEAVNYYYAGDIPNTLYGFAFSDVRLKTAESWLKLEQVFSSDRYNTEFSQGLLQELSLQRLDDSNIMITYADSLNADSFNTDAKNQYATSSNAYDNENYVYSLFESLRALSNANLAIEVEGINEEQLMQRINLSKELARENINKAQALGVTPIMALSYYEYASSFEYSQPSQALLFLEYSKQFATLSIQMVYEITGSYPVTPESIISEDDIGLRLALVLISVAAGMMVTLYFVVKAAYK